MGLLFNESDTKKKDKFFLCFNLQHSELILKYMEEGAADRFKEQIMLWHAQFIMCTGIVKSQLITVNYLLIVAPWNLWDKDQV